MTETIQDKALQEVKDFLCGYQTCIDMLNLRAYERKRRQPFDEACTCTELLGGDEAYWQARMYEVSALIDGMRNSREKLVLYYHYIKGERIERVADFLGISRRTAYRMHQKGLLQISFLYRAAKKNGLIYEASKS